MTTAVSYRAATVVTGAHEPDGCVDAPRWVTVDDGHIAAVGVEPPSGTRQVDLGDVALWPGLVDLHTDTLTRFESPRPGTRIPIPVAVRDTVVDAALHGITRPLICVAVGEGPRPGGGLDRARSVIAALDDLTPVLPTRPAIHLRVDIGSQDAEDHARGLLESHAPSVALVSVMDHTPGRRQFEDTSTWRDAMRVRTGAGDDELDQWLTWLPLDRADADARRARIGALAGEFATPFASHDDDTADATADAAAHGATISEFPLTADAAGAARRAGLGVVMGAPNAWRGRSHLGALSAREALRAGHLDALTSDYHHPALVHAARALTDAGLCRPTRAVELITSAPARLLGDRSGTATLEPGNPADMIAVAGAPLTTVSTTWVDGRAVIRRWVPSTITGSDD